MKVIMLKGISKTGKTTTAERIICELKRRGYSVGSVKDIHNTSFAMDTEGTNTHRHKVAGAELVTARGRNETDIMYPYTLPIDQILDFYTQDYVVLEGDSGANCPIILTAREESELAERMNDRVIAVSGVISERLTEYCGLPVINGLTDIGRLVDLIEEKTMERMPNVDPECCGRCGGDCRSMTARILRGEADREDCVLKKGDVELFFDGKEIPMVPFIQEMLSNIVIGTVKALKGYRDGDEIVVKIRQK
jgi:molybdopterin-guanine dinucleotide biosynthesis protein B